MAGTRTFRGMMGRCSALKEQYTILLEAAKKDGSTLAQYAGSERLKKLSDEINDLISESLNLTTPSNRYEVNAAIIPLLYTVEQHYCNACLFECDQAANYEDYAPITYSNFTSF